MLAVLLFGFLPGLPASAQSSENTPAHGNELVRGIIANEIKAETQDHSHWAFRLETEKSGKIELAQVVETRDGNLQLPVSINGKPLSAKEKEQANAHVDQFVHHPATLRKSLREENEDTARTQNLLRLLPQAFNFTDEGNSSGDLVKLKFTPNPNFHPPSREATVFHAMEGEMIVDKKQQRLAELSGHLIHEVKFGGGLLGYLKPGGEFHVKQEEVASGYWELTLLNVRMQGKALFFKTIAVQQKTLRSNFHRVSDDLTIAQAAEILRQSTSTTVASSIH
jgi:hypothetical protein